MDVPASGLPEEKMKICKKSTKAARPVLRSKRLKKLDRERRAWKKMLELNGHQL